MFKSNLIVEHRRKIDFSNLDSLGVNFFTIQINFFPFN